MSADVGSVVRGRRERMHLTQMELAAVAGLSRGTIRNAEEGKPLEDETLRRITLALGIVPAPSSPAGFAAFLTETSVMALTKVITDAVSSGAPPEVVDDFRKRFFALITWVADPSSSISGDDESNISSFLTHVPMGACEQIFKDIGKQRPELNLPDIDELTAVLRSHLSVVDKAKNDQSSVQGSGRPSAAITTQADPMIHAQATSLGLSLRAEEALRSGVLRDSEVFEAPEGTLQIVVLTVARKPGKYPQPSTRDRNYWRRMLKALLDENCKPIRPAFVERVLSYRESKRIGHEAADRFLQDIKEMYESGVSVDVIAGFLDVKVELANELLADAGAFDQRPEGSGSTPHDSTGDV